MTDPASPSYEAARDELGDVVRALEAGGTTLEDVGAIMNLTRERIRQVEVKALAKLEALRDMMALRDFVDEGPVGKRRLPVLSKADLRGIEGEAAPSAEREAGADADVDADAEDWDDESEFEDDRPVDLTLFDG